MSSGRRGARSTLVLAVSGEEATGSGAGWAWVVVGGGSGVFLPSGHRIRQQGGYRWPDPVSSASSAPGQIWVRVSEDMAPAWPDEDVSADSVSSLAGSDVVSSPFGMSPSEYSPSFCFYLFYFFFNHLIWCLTSLIVVAATCPKNLSPLFVVQLANLLCVGGGGGISNNIPGKNRRIVFCPSQIWLKQHVSIYFLFRFLLRAGANC